MYPKIILLSFQKFSCNYLEFLSQFFFEKTGYFFTNSFAKTNSSLGMGIKSLSVTWAFRISSVQCTCLFMFTNFKLLLCLKPVSQPSEKLRKEMSFILRRLSVFWYRHSYIFPALQECFSSLPISPGTLLV